MEFVQHVPRTDLARRTRQVLGAVQRGQIAIIEGHGQPEVAIIDIVDYWLTRAVMVYYARPQAIDRSQGLSAETVQQVTSKQERYNLVMAHYLAEAISLARAAELLQVSWFDLRNRAIRLDIPLRPAPDSLNEANEDVATALEWA